MVHAVVLRVIAEKILSFYKVIQGKKNKDHLTKMNRKSMVNFFNSRFRLIHLVKMYLYFPVAKMVLSFNFDRWRNCGRWYVTGKCHRELTPSFFFFQIEPCFSISSHYHLWDGISFNVFSHYYLCSALATNNFTVNCLSPPRCIPRQSENQPSPQPNKIK